MAQAEAYDGWDDPGLAYSEEQIAGHRPSAYAERRVAELVADARTILALLALPDTPKADWWKAVEVKLVDCATWYCRVAEIPGIDRAELAALPPRASAAGKELTLAAQRLDAQSFMDAWATGAQVGMTGFVTLGRRCAGATQISGWKKREKSLSNKIANAINREISASEKLSIQLASLSG